MKLSESIQQINEIFSENFTFDELKDKFIYLTNPSRDFHISESKLESAILNESVGELLAKYNVTAFNLMKQEL